MKNKNLNLPIFPLPVFLLPEGITRLRIFETRYLKMIRIAAQGQGFVICLANIEEKIIGKIWGSWVEIINFDQGEDGILEVDIKCKSLVEIGHINRDSDNLHFGDMTYIDHWPETNIDLSTDKLSASLQELFESNALLNDLYPDKKINNPRWVVSRWLEILPMDDNSKTSFIDKTSFKSAKIFVEDII